VPGRTLAQAMPPETHSLVGRDLEAPLLFELPGGSAAVFTCGGPGKDGPNEDAALLLVADGDRTLLAVADGMGGQNAGERASAAAVGALAVAVERYLGEGRTFREAILTGFEEANAAVLDLRLGAGTTLAAVGIEGRAMRAYHVGDSEVLAVGQRGRRKLQTVSHSPVGYAVEAGLLGEREALAHADRHIVSNALGDAEMRVDMSRKLELAARDTALLGSDGLFDNLHVGELVQIIRKGPLARVAQTLKTRARSRMERPGDGRPSKPDDLTFLLYRPHP